MSKNQDDQVLTDKIIIFTDDVMDGKDIHLDTDNDSLRQLQEIVVRLERVGEGLNPSAAMAARMRRKLQNAWVDEQARSSQSWLERLFRPKQGWQSKAKRRNQVFTQVAVAVVILMIVVGPLLTGGDGGLQGTANGNTNYLPLVIFGFVATIIYFVWRERK